MNFKERGFTVGDLIILLLVISFSFFIVNKIKESKNQQKMNSLYRLEILKSINA